MVYEPNVVTISQRGLHPPSAYPYPGCLESPWDQLANCASEIAPQNSMSPPIPFSEVMGQHDAYPVASFTSALPFEEPTMPSSHNDNILTPASEVNPIGVHSDVQQGQLAYLVVLHPEEGINARMAPTVVRHTVGPPAMIAASERRRKLPRKYACHICGHGFTTKANRDSHVRAHRGIRPFVCICGTGFTARADLARHRKGSGCPFTK